ncbi:unnamed protein product, partial [Brenthis ino]
MLILHSVAARSVDGEMHGAESDSGLPTRSTARKFYFKGYEGWVAGRRGGSRTWQRAPAERGGEGATLREPRAPRTAVAAAAAAARPR